ncbi:hypothetical protein GCM10029976_093660 [Kribbella albertanoniae]|uniref:Uncharacterized protein n=1 Tax=Kribbella albertanoniae TaxID=1266829 RepID=A0A4R4QG13_9ACTN|nr:DUF6000 family protein [Kribbella albertanoniae]TDC34606.1 hypothetical protein E1261_03010 [Kribbella albertanoniae]
MRRRYSVYGFTWAEAMPRWQQRWFQWRLRRTGRRIPAEALDAMLESGLKAGRVATWFIAAGRRSDLRPTIRRDFLGEGPNRLRGDYCRALASLGTEEDAQILVAYLDHALTLPLEEPEWAITECQPLALGTLRYLDEQLGTDYSERFIATDGPWERWPGNEDGAWADDLDWVRSDVALATGGDPGIRRQVLAEEDFKTWEFAGPRWWWWFSRGVRRRLSRRG